MKSCVSCFLLALPAGHLCALTSRVSFSLVARTFYEYEITVSFLTLHSHGISLPR